MNTTCEISTISYNSDVFLASVLDELIDKGFISFYCFIKHKGEFDDVLHRYDKDHIHLFVRPNLRIDTVDLGKRFIEPVDGKKPLKCIDWHKSVSDDFILYNLHDRDYLLSKFEYKQYFYTYDDWFYSDKDEFDHLYVKAFKSSGYARWKNLYAYAKKGGNLQDLLRAGAVPPNQVRYILDFIKECK